MSGPFPHHFPLFLMARTLSSPPLKYVVGIDLAKDTFVACLGSIDAAQRVHVAGKLAEFANDAAGFAALHRWVVTGQRQAGLPVSYVLEATGCYYEELAYYLDAQQLTVSVLLPQKVRHFALSTEVKSKTDALDARLLCRLGLERALPVWRPLTPALRQLRLLTRERGSLRGQLTQLQNRRHAAQHSFEPDTRALARLAQLEALLAAQVAEIEAQMAQLVAADPVLACKIGHLTSLPGVGLVTAATVVGETNGFALVENERQLASYAGLDVVQRQSGQLARATSISKRGNARLRTALYLPAVSSLRYNPHHQLFYARRRAQAPNGKPGVIAVMRKLLLLTYTLWKKDCPYDPHHGLPTRLEKEVAPTTDRAGATQDEPALVLLEEDQR